MTIIILLVFVFVFYTPLTTQDGSVNEYPVICIVIENINNLSTYVFNIKEIPERCNIITVPQYSFDRGNDNVPIVMESDKSIMKILEEAKKPFFVPIGFDSDDCDWTTIFNPLDEAEFQKQTLDPLINLINTYNIYGIIIDCPPIYYDYYIDGITQNLTSFVNKVKNEAKNLKVGIKITGQYYQSFSNNSLLDFKILNEVLDLYIIEIGALNDCTKNNLKTGVSPITSTNPDLITIEQVTNGAMNSAMDKMKIYVKMTISAFRIFDTITKKGTNLFINYAEYCSSSNSSQMCTNPSKLSYDQGAYAKKFYAGIFLESLNTDDYDGKCGCKKFPVTNLIIDGWTGCTFENCKQLDS